MNKDWQRRRLGDCATVSTGPFGSLLHKSDYVDAGVPLVNPTNIVGGHIVPDPTKLIDDATKRRLSPYVLEEGDVVVGRRGELGRCAVVGSDQSGWVCGTGSFFIRPRPSIDSQFLAHLIRSDGYREKLEQAATGATMLNLSNTALGDLSVLVPSVPEQKRIVGILNEAFEGIAATKTNAEKNLQDARALFESYLNSVFTQRGKGWVEKSLGDLCDVLDCRRKPITKRDRVAGAYPYYGATGVLDHVEGYLFDEKLVLVGEDGAKWGAGENSAFAVDGKCWVNNHAHVLRPHRSLVLDNWLIYFLNISDLADFVSGLTVPKLNQGRLRDIPIPLPSLPEQKRLLAVADSLREDTQRLASLYQRKLTALDVLKRSLLQQAFVGSL